MRGSTLITALCVIWAVPCPARTITVDADGPADFQMIQAAIDDANDGDVIIIAPGRYTGVGNRDIDLKNKPVTIRSTDPNDPNIVADTIIDCNGTEAAPHCGFYFLGELGPTWRYTEYALSGVTIINGYSPNGGAIICLESHVAVSQCVITDNSAGQHGGGIFCGGWADIEINSSIIARNSAGIHGGGIVIGHPWSDLQIKDCIISQNSANEEGGGIANWGRAPHQGIADDHCCGKESYLTASTRAPGNKMTGLLLNYL